MTGIVVEEIEVIDPIIVPARGEEELMVLTNGVGTRVEKSAFQQAALTQVQQGSHYVAAHAEYRRLYMGCGEPLMAQRLKAMPNAVLCVDCKEEERK